MSETHFILVTYDIPNDRRRTKVARELLNYGMRVQYSVFECLLNDKRDQEMRRKLKRLLDEKEDSVRYYQLCVGCKNHIEIQGLGEVVEDEEFWIF